MNVQRVAIDRIKPAVYNPRLDLKPGDPEYEKLKRSLSEYGLVEPLVWNERTGNLVGGHQRFKVLLSTGATQVDVSVVDLSPQREKALNLALNKIGGDWDSKKLAALLDEMVRLDNLDVTLTGFDLPEIDDLIARQLLATEHDESFDVEAALAQAGPAVTRPGDLILLGTDSRTQHRLLCGDSTDPHHVRRLMNGQKASLFATDPPYLVDYNGTNHPGTSRADVLRKNKDWSGTYGERWGWDEFEANKELYAKFIAVAVAEAIHENAAWYCWHASRRQAMLEAAWEAHGAFVHQQIIWNKNRGILTRSWYSWQHEPCLFGWKRGQKPFKADDAAFLTSVWDVPTLATGDERPDHPTPKPLALFEIPMKQHTRGGDVCYEPFAGSGTQIIAAQRLGRRCYALELSPVYCDLIVRRFIAFAGPSAVAPELAEKYALPRAKEAIALTEPKTPSPPRSSPPVPESLSARSAEGKEAVHGD
ncbi:MAG: DNA modification methylase [Planctomycetes bacterium]|nr:DNA modification methylase [Planctomycetota bacterium]